MLRYFPFSTAFDLRMGTAPMKADDTIVETDEHYLKEIRLKRELLREDHAYYFQSVLPDASAEWDALGKIAHDLARHDPANFTLEKNDQEWNFSNRRLNEKATFILGDNTTLPYSPLDWIGRQVQEDLVILNEKGEVVAGQLCFPSGWALEEKIGRQFIEVHAPLPALTAPMIQAANTLIERIPFNKPVARNNWGFRLGDQLDLSSRHTSTYRKRLLEESGVMSVNTIGQKIFLRVEHQTLTRLQRSGYILFTIHTYNSPLSDEASHQERRETMLRFLESTPPELIEYKAMTPFFDLLKEYLRVYK